MSALPVPRLLHGESTLEEVVNAFNQFQLEAINALNGRMALTASNGGTVKSNIVVQVDAAGAASVRVTHGLPGVVAHLVPSRMKRSDGVAIAAVWGWDWLNLSATEVQVTFFGLVDSSQYVCSLVMLQ